MYFKNCNATNHVAGVDPFNIVDYVGYLSNDEYFTYFPNDNCKHIFLYAGTEITVLNHKTINGFKKAIVNDEIVFIKEKYISKNIPYITYNIADNGKKRYMDWNCITDTTSDQWKLQNYNAYTGFNGIRMVENRYCIAIGSYFTTQIGTKIDVDLLSDDGSINTIKCILGDCKANVDTCSNNIYAKDGSILEFIVNTSSLTDKARLHGDLSHLSEELNGKVISVKIYKEG